MASRYDDNLLSKFAAKELETVIHGSDGPQETKKFSKFKSNKDRYTYARKKVQSLDDMMVDIKSGAKKCSLTAEMLKSEGNTAFGRHQFEKAQELFTLSAAYAVPDHLDGGGKNTLALAIANRSGALFYVSKFKEALIDIENALQVGYPEELKYKLYDRKGKCYQALKGYKEAKLAFELAATLLDKATLVGEKKETTLKQIQKNIHDCARTGVASIEVDLNLPGDLPKLADGPNVTHPSLSSACRVEYKSSKGRCVIAARDIKPGEVLLVEKPFASVFKPHDNYKDCCHHCFYPCDTLLPCLKCTRGRYCSTDCRDVAWETYHKYECGVPLHELIGEGKDEHLAIRIVFTAGLDYLLEFQHKRYPGEEKKSKGCNEAGQYLSSDYTSVSHLQSNEDLPVQCYYTAAFASVFLTKLLEKIGLFDSIKKETKDTAMACVGGYLISYLVTQVAYIAHHIFMPQGYDTREMVGTSVASTYGLFNHSCDTKTAGTFYGNHIVLHSMESFKQGQEVTVNYGHMFANCNRESRREWLQQLAFFQCSCEPCRHDWPLLQHLSSQPTFRCTSCAAPLPAAQTEVTRCPRCKLTQSLTAKKDAFNAASKLYQQTRQSNDIQLQLEYTEAIDQLVVQPWRDYVACKGMLLRSFWKKGSSIHWQYKE